MQGLSSKQLRRAADLKEKIEKLQKQLTAIASGGIISPHIKFTRRAKRKMSTAAIAKIRAVQKARWAKIKSSAKPVAKFAVKKKRKFSIAGRPIPVPPYKKNL